MAVTLNSVKSDLRVSISLMVSYYGRSRLQPSGILGSGTKVFYMAEI